MLTEEQLDYLRKWDTPTIANGLEWGELPEKHGQSRLDGVFSPKIRSILPDLGIVNGYAATATIRASRPREDSDPYASNCRGGGGSGGGRGRWHLHVGHR
ncbi:MAG TPA: hypothetical protein QF901_10225, partial [Gammaproteobacteria bacterium]|nr:hypothetical protein [Gammaproteobacteria bacterium]